MFHDSTMKTCFDVFQSEEKLSSFLQWAISSALQAESEKFHQNKVSQHCFSVISDEEESEDSLVSKLLRWLTASVILGKLASKSKDLDPEIGSNLKDLLSSFERAESECEEGREDRINCDEFLASTILYLQLLVGTNYKVLPSVISALSILLENALSLAGILIHLFVCLHDSDIFFANTKNQG